MNKDTARQWVNVLALVVALAVNALASLLPLFGRTTAEISDQFPVYFTPAGYVFSIWGVIYLALIAFVVYQVLPAQRDNPTLRRIGLLFTLSCILNAAWLVLWHYLAFAWCLVVMVGLLLTLVAIYLKLNIGKSHVGAAQKWLVDIPFSIYLGWITVATIANVTTVLDYFKWGGWGLSPEIWTAIMLGVGVIVAALLSITRRDVAYLLVLIWAFIGIALKHVTTTLVSSAAWAAAALVAILLLLALVRRQRRLTA
jgi:benzodiazapine receptor